MHVLVVEDDTAIREFVAEALADEGHRVRLAGHGAAALEAVRSAPPDLILLDMRMPVLDGWEFARRYRAAPGPHAPIVCMTAAADAAARAAAIGADATLAKPFDLVALLSVVEHFAA